MTLLTERTALGAAYVVGLAMGFWENLDVAENLLIW